LDDSVRWGTSSQLAITENFEEDSSISGSTSDIFPPSAEQNDVDILITEYEKKDNFMDNVEGAVKLAMFLLFIVMAAGAFYGAAYVDDLNREECVRGGGRVVEVHGARPSGFTAPWMCQR
jgi:hypothetical protein